MPHKLNSAFRHKFSKKQYRVTNWPEYNESLRQRGDLTIWVTDEALNQWRAPRRSTPGGQPKYSDFAIATCLTLRTIYKLPLRQTQGLMRSIARLMGVEIPVPDFSTLSRRAQGLELPEKQRIERPAPIHLTVDSSGLKIFGEGALSAACCACACRVRNGCRTSMKPRPNASHGANCIWAWT
jgi:hypothetical protein